MLRYKSWSETFGEQPSESKDQNIFQHRDRHHGVTTSVRVCVCTCRLHAERTGQASTGCRHRLDLTLHQL